MTTLHLGVVELPYSNKTSGVSTTGDVAEILEGKYHVFEHFFQLHQDEIIGHLKESIEGAFESVAMGARPVADPHAAGTEEIARLFNVFLDQREMDSLGYPGIPTKAAQRGVSHRYKKPYARRPARPSFIDTGLYESAMRAWVD